MTKEARTYDGVKTVYSVNAVGKTGQVHAKKKKKRKKEIKEKKPLARMTKYCGLVYCLHQ